MLILGFFLVGYSQVIFADFARYTAVQLDAYNVTQAQCMDAGIKAGKIAGIPEIHGFSDTKTQAVGENKEGYTIQFLCLTYKNIAFYVINGLSPKEKDRIYNIFYKEFKKNLGKK